MMMIPTKAAMMMSPIGKSPVEAPLSEQVAMPPSVTPRTAKASVAHTTNAASAAFHAGSFSPTSAMTSTATGMQERAICTLFSVHAIVPQSFGA